MIFYLPTNGAWGRPAMTLPSEPLSHQRWSLTEDRLSHWAAWPVRYSTEWDSQAAPLPSPPNCKGLAFL